MSEGSESFKTLVLGPGQCGVNNLRNFVDDTLPEEAPGMEFVPIDSARMLLQARFPRSSNVGTESGDGEKTNLQRWFESDRLDPIQLERSIGEEDEEKNDLSEELEEETGLGPDEFDHHRLLFGAGGDVKAGRRAFKSALPKIEEKIKASHLVICWGAGGGGTGTAGMSEIARVCKRLRRPLISILTTPWIDEGSKTVVADKLRKELKELCWVLTVKNQYTPEKVMEMPLSDVFKYINQETRPLFRALKAQTQVVGISHADPEDTFTAMRRGRDICIGTYVVPKELLAPREVHKAVKVETKEAIERLMNPVFQDKGEKGIIAEAGIFTFFGLWSAKAQGEIRGGISEAAHLPKDAFTKSLVFEEAEEMSVSVFMTGTYPSEKLAQDRASVLAIEPFLEDRRAEIQRRYNRESKTALYLMHNGKGIDYRVPVSIRNEWHHECESERPDIDTIDKLREEIALFDPEGKNRKPDEPEKVRRQRRILGQGGLQ